MYSNFKDEKESRNAQHAAFSFLYILCMLEETHVSLLVHYHKKAVDR